MVKVLAGMFGKPKNDGIKVNDMAPEAAVGALNNFFSGFGK